MVTKTKIIEEEKVKTQYEYDIESCQKIIVEI